MRQPLVAGNWKMNGDLAGNADLIGGLVAGLSDAVRADIVVCPPHVYLAQVGELVAGSAIALGAQDVSTQPAGAFTGEISTAMLDELGCRYVIVGHSERRSMHGESDRLVAEKFAAAHQAGLVPIFCVGELRDERERGETEQVIARQIDALLDGPGVALLDGGVIAYEPVWAIGTGLTATPKQAQEVHAFIRDRVAGRDAAIAQGVRILYGGSVKPGNAPEIFSMPDIDGGLIGGAALQAKSFLSICRAAV